MRTIANGSTTEGLIRHLWAEKEIDTSLIDSGQGKNNYCRPRYVLVSVRNRSERWSPYRRRRLGVERPCRVTVPLQGSNSILHQAAK
jgi:hypothetical protein